jgi:hypothetical protein
VEKKGTKRSILTDGIDSEGCLLDGKRKLKNYMAMLHLACTWITFRAAGLFG